MGWLKGTFDNFSILEMHKIYTHGTIDMAPKKIALTAILPCSNTYSYDPL